MERDQPAWKLEASLGAQRELWGTLHRRDDTGAPVELDLQLRYHEASDLPPRVEADGCTGYEPIDPPVELEIGGRPVIVELLAHFYGGFLGVETSYEPPAWRFQLRARTSIGEGASMATLAIDAEQPVDGLDQPPRPEPYQVFSKLWHPTLDAIDARDPEALEGSPLITAIRALLEREQPLAQRSVDSLIAIETRPEDGEPRCRPWNPDQPVVHAAAKPGTRLELAFILQREVETAHLDRIRRSSATASGRRVELTLLDEGERRVEIGQTGADGVSRLSVDLPGPAAIPFKIALSSSPADQVRGEIRLRYGREVEASLDSGSYQRAPLPAQLDPEVLARVAAEDLCRAHDPDHGVFRGWCGDTVLHVDIVGPIESELLGGVDLEACSERWPDAALAWRALRRTALAASSPPPDSAELERPYWDADMTRALLSCLETGRTELAAQRAEELAWRLERSYAPLRRVVSKAHVGLAEDRDPASTRALAAYTLARAARVLDRPELAITGGRNLIALLDDGVDDLSIRGLARLATAGVACAAAGASDLADRGHELGARALERLVERGQARDLEETLEVLAHARGHLPSGAPGLRSA